MEILRERQAPPALRAAGVKMPFTIKRTSWNAVDTLTIVNVTPNAQIDDAKFAQPKRQGAAIARFVVVPMSVRERVSAAR